MKRNTADPAGVRDTPGDQLSRGELSRRVKETLEEWVSPITAETAIRCACERFGGDAALLKPGDLKPLARELESSLRLYLDPPEVVQACRSIHRLGRSAEESRASEPEQYSCAIVAEHHVVEARTAALELAKRIGFDQVDAVKLATVVSELARNIIQYAGLGTIELRSIAGPRMGIEIIATDEGPGIANLDAVLSGSYRSQTGMGLGLRGSQRLVDELRVDTQVQRGTRVVVRKYVKR